MQTAKPRTIKQKKNDTEPGVSARHPWEKHGAILAMLRRRIVAGEFRPGDRIPPRHELGRHFGTTMATIQKALGALERDGFIESRGREGTIVSDHPPHLSRYALVFATGDGDQEIGPNSRYHRVLASQSKVLSRKPNCVITPYWGIDSHVDTEAYQTLVGELRSERLAGLIFVDPNQSRHSPVMEADVPRVGILSAPRFEFPLVSVVERSFVDKAMHYLAARGRRRVAVVVPSHVELEYATLLEKSAAEHGLILNDERILALHPHSAKWARRAAKLLVTAGKSSERPDALIITDEHLAEAVGLGLSDIGLRVPQDLDVIAHASFPEPAPAPETFVRLGPDLRQLLSVCIGSIDAQRRGEKQPPMTRLVVSFERELSSALDTSKEIANV